MIGIVRERTHHDFDGRAVLTAATFVMRNRHHTVNVRILLSAVQRELGHDRDLLGFMTGAHAGWHNQDVVAGSDSAFRAAKTHESCAFTRRHIVRRRHAGVFAQMPHDGNIVRHVIDGDLLTFSNAARRSDRLTKLPYEFTGRNITRAETVARGHRVTHFDHAPIRQQHLLARDALTLYYGNVVVRIDDNRPLAYRAHHHSVKDDGHFSPQLASCQFMRTASPAKSTNGHLGANAATARDSHRAAPRAVPGHPRLEFPTNDESFRAWRARCSRRRLTEQSAAPLKLLPDPK